MLRGAVAAMICPAAVLLAPLVGAAPAAAGTIREIVVVNNYKTTDDTVRYIAGIEEGDDWSDDVKDRVRIELVSSGLFRSVELYAEPHPRGGIKVTVVAVDKHSWIVAPTFYNQPNNRGAGFGFGENNLFGENKKLLLYGQVATGDSFFLGAFIDPSIRGTAWSWAVDLFFRYERVIEYNAPTSYQIREPETEVTEVRESKLKYLNGGLKLGVTLFRSLTLSQRVRAAQVAYYKTRVREEDGATLDDLGGVLAEPGPEGWDVSTETVLVYDRRANWYGVRRGSRLKLGLEKALPVVGSDFDYWYSTLSAERAWRLFVRHNFIVRGLAGYGWNLPFQQEYTSGGTALRGYENRQFRGNLKGSANVEYSVPLVGYNGWAFRGLVFADSAYTTFWNLDEGDRAHRNYLPNSGPDAELGLTPLKNAVGGGVRLYVRQIVLPLLGFDVGYGIESRGIEMYFALGLTDL